MKPSPDYSLNRRRFFAASSCAAVAVGSGASARVAARLSDDNFQYELNRTDEEWRSMLAGDEYGILREGYTEQQKSSPLWEEVRDGSYHCKGCDLHTFDANWKRQVDGKGWVFFYHAVPNSIMTDVDGSVPEYGSMAEGKDALAEIHCRRCGSHLGHLLVVAGEMTHCINGGALNFELKSS